MRCALGHDWLTGMRGGEKVLEVLCELFPGEEDSGIVSLAAQACGRPVIACRRGGSLETVAGIDDPGGSPTAEGLGEAITRFEDDAGVFRPRTLRARALGLSRETCKAALRARLFEDRKG